MPRWDPGRYLEFDRERSQPAIDLVGRIDLEPARAVDLGCGPGTSGAVVLERWPSVDLTGVDSSPEMIAAASARAPSQRWVLGDAARWVAQEPVDLVVSNAALHWVPDHARLVPHLLAQLAPGGALAVQMPRHHNSAVHAAARELAESLAWKTALGGVGEPIRCEPPAFYHDLLAPRCERLELWETIYHHALADPAAIVRWVSGSGLRPYLEALPDLQTREAFATELLAEADRRYPRRSDGRVVLPYHRLFFVAYVPR